MLQSRCFVENLYTPLRVAKRSAEIGTGFVYFSSEYAFDGLAGPYDEAAKPRPLSVYGKSKLAAEEELTDTISKLIVVRTTVVYGPEAQRKNFVYQLLEKTRSGQRMIVPNDQVSTRT